VLSDCFVPSDAVLGERGRGFHQIMAAFQLERLTLAGMGIGHAAECLAAATAYARARDVFGVPLISKQAIRHRLAALSVELEAARLLTYRAAARLDAGHPGAGDSVAMAKYHAAIAACRIVDECVQLFGGSGFLEETPVARHYRDARVLRIGGARTKSSWKSWPRDCPRDRTGHRGARRASAAARRRRYLRRAQSPAGWRRRGPRRDHHRRAR